MGKAYNSLKKRIKKIKKNLKEASYSKFYKSDRQNSSGDTYGRGGGWPPNGWCPPFLKTKSPWGIILLCPKAIVLYVILVVLLLCGVSLYGLVILILLAIIFILI